MFFLLLASNRGTQPADLIFNPTPEFTLKGFTNMRKKTLRDNTNSDEMGKKGALKGLVVHGSSRIFTDLFSSSQSGKIRVIRGQIFPSAVSVFSAVQSAGQPRNQSLPLLATLLQVFR